MPPQSPSVLTPGFSPVAPQGVSTGAPAIADSNLPPIVAGEVDAVRRQRAEVAAAPVQPVGGHPLTGALFDALMRDPAIASDPQKARTIATAIANDLQKVGGFAFEQRSDALQQYRQIAATAIIQNRPDLIATGGHLTGAGNVMDAISAAQQAGVQRRDAPTAENLRSWGDDRTALQETSRVYGRAAGALTVEIEEARRNDDTTQVRVLEARLETLRTAYTDDSNRVTHLDRRQGFESARADARELATSVEVASARERRIELQRQRDVRELEGGITTFARDLVWARHIGSDTAATAANERYSALVLRHRQLIDSDPALREQLQQRVTSATSAAVTDLHRATGTLAVLDSALAKTPVDASSALLTLRRSTSGELDLVSRELARRGQGSLEAVLRGKLAPTDFAGGQLLLAGNRAGFDAAWITRIAQSPASPMARREELRQFAAQLSPTELQVALGQLQQRGDPRNNGVTDIENRLGRDMALWLRATAREERPAAAAIRLHQAIHDDNAPIGDLIKTLAEMPPEQRAEIDGAYHRQYGHLGQHLQRDVERRTRTAAEERIVESIFSRSPSVLREELALRSLGLLGNEWERRDNGSILGRDGELFYQGKANFAYVNLREFNRVIQSLDGPARRDLLARIEGQLPRGVTLEQAYDRTNGLPAGRLIRQLLTQGPVPDSAMNDYLRSYENQDPRTTILRATQGKYITETLTLSRTLIGGAERNEAVSRRGLEELENGGLTQFFSWASGTLDAQRDTNAADQRRVDQTRTKLGELQEFFRTSERHNVEFRRLEDDGRIAALFARTPEEVASAQETLNRAQTTFDAALTAVTGRSAFADAREYMSSLRAANVKFDSAIQWLDSTERNLRTTRKVLVVAGATIATGGLASAPALAGYGFVATSTIAVAGGTLTGTTISGLSNLTEATGHTINGNMSASEAFSQAGDRIAADAKQSAYASVSTVLGLRVFKTLIPNAQAATTFQRVLAGSRAGGAGAAANHTIQLPERFVTACNDFERSFGHLPPDQKDEMFTKFMEQRRLDPVSIVRDAFTAYTLGSVSGGIASRANIAASVSTTNTGLVVVRTTEVAALTTVGLTGAAAKNAAEGRPELLRSDEIVAEMTSVLVGQGANRTQRTGIARLDRPAAVAPSGLPGGTGAQVAGGNGQPQPTTGTGSPTPTSTIPATQRGVTFHENPDLLRARYIEESVAAMTRQKGSPPTATERESIVRSAQQIDAFYNPTNGDVHVLRIDATNPNRMVRIIETSRIVHELAHRGGGNEIAAITKQLDYLLKNGYQSSFTRDGQLIIEPLPPGTRGTPVPAAEIERVAGLAYGPRGDGNPLQPVVGHFGRLQRYVAQTTSDPQLQQLARTRQPTREQLQEMIGAAQRILGENVTFYDSAGRFAAPMWGSVTRPMQREVKVSGQTTIVDTVDVVRGFRFDPPHPTRGGQSDHGLGNDNWHMHVFDLTAGRRTSNVDVKLAFDESGALRVQAQTREGGVLAWRDVSVERARELIAEARAGADR